MKFVKKIILFIKNVFCKKEKIKVLEGPKQVKDKTNFIKSLRINVVRKNKVETLICDGDGLGINNIIKY